MEYFILIISVSATAWIIRDVFIKERDLNKKESERAKETQENIKRMKERAKDLSCS